MKRSGMALAVALSAAPAFAQEARVSAGVGVLAEAFQPYRGIGANGWVTGHLRFRHGDRWAWEPTVAYGRRSRRFLDLESQDEDFQVGVDALYLFPRVRADFHVGVGVGVRHQQGRLLLDGEQELSHRETRAYYHIRQGLDWKLSRRTSLFAAVRMNLPRGALGASAGLRVGF
jgi:hypothetical protein